MPLERSGSMSFDSLPDIDLDDDGDIRLDWWFARDCVLGIYITSDGKLGYASLVGRESHSGEIDLPEPIKEFFREMQESSEV